MAGRKRTRPGERHNPLSADQSKDMKEIGKGLGQLFGGGQRKEPYTPVNKSLDQIGLEPRVMDIMIGEKPVQCFVIPIEELVYKEWQHMTDSKFKSSASYDTTANAEEAGNEQS